MIEGELVALNRTELRFKFNAVSASVSDDKKKIYVRRRNRRVLRTFFCGVLPAQHAPPMDTYRGHMPSLLWVPKVLQVVQLVVLLTTFHTPQGVPTFLQGTTYFLQGTTYFFCRVLPPFFPQITGPTAKEKKDKIAINGDRKRSSVNTSTCAGAHEFCPRS